VFASFLKHCYTKHMTPSILIVHVCSLLSSVGVKFKEETADAAKNAGL
jgi:hypothetical protein